MLWSGVYAREYVLKDREIHQKVVKRLYVLSTPEVQTSSEWPANARAGPTGWRPSQEDDGALVLQEVLLPPRMDGADDTDDGALVLQEVLLPPRMDSADNTSEDSGCLEGQARRPCGTNPRNPRHFGTIEGGRNSVSVRRTTKKAESL